MASSSRDTGLDRNFHDPLTPSQSTDDMRIPLHSSDSLMLPIDDNAQLNPKHKIFVGYSEKDILPLMNWDNKCERAEALETQKATGMGRTLIVIAKEKMPAPRHTIYIVRQDEDIGVIEAFMQENKEEGEWYTVPSENVEILLDNYDAQVSGRCSFGPTIPYPSAFLIAAVTQVANFKLAKDYINDDWKVALGISLAISSVAMFYMKAAYTNNLFNQKRVEFNPGTSQAQSIFVNPACLSVFRSKSTERLYAIGAPVAAMSISTDVALSLTEMTKQFGAGIAGLVFKTVEDLLTNSLRAVEQLRLINPGMCRAHEIPGLGYLYRSSVGQGLQKAFVGGLTIGLVAAAYTIAAFKTPNLFEENPAIYLKVISGVIGGVCALGTVPLYSLYELEAAERSLVRTGNPISADSRLRYFQNKGKEWSKNASNSSAKKTAYTVGHMLAQGNAIGVGVTTLLAALLREIAEMELTPLQKSGLLMLGLTAALIFTLSKNKRVFEQEQTAAVEEVVDPADALVQQHQAVGPVMP